MVDYNKKTVRIKSMKEAKLYKKQKEEKVKCMLCNHNCLIEEGAKGLCGVRINKEGRLYTLNYGELIAQNIDPIEKKPFYHFMPKTTSYSIATPGCNFSCRWCQNYSISQLTKEDFEWEKETIKTKPKEVVENAKENNCQSIAYTYTEPTIFFEFALKTMKLAHKENLKNVWVSNGYFSQKAYNEISPYLDAINIDLKSFKEKTYQKYCKAQLAPVKENIEMIAQNKDIHLEITSLIIPQLNDSKKEIRQIAQFIASLDRNTAWHLSRFYPAYKMKKHSATSRQTLEKAQKIGQKTGLVNVHLGNV